MNFQKKLDLIIKKNNSLLCIGLDSDFEKIPEFLKKKKFLQFEFNQAIIKRTYNLVCSYKLNSAFYEARGVDGIGELKKTCDYLKKNHSEIPLILDAKRADIGNTNNGYVNYAFDYLGVDAITLHPYLGKEAIEPFLKLKDKGLIILCRTSNPGAGEFQDLIVNGESLYIKVAKAVIKNWNKNNNCLLVVGATYPEEMRRIRKIVGEMTFLVPGIGTQGGEVEATVKAGLNTKKAGLIIHSARGIIFAGKDKDFAKRALEEAVKLRDEINKYRGQSIKLPVNN
jgi:orotidine-5'-phosphate decarboxylase